MADAVERFEHAVSERIRTHAMSLPEAAEGSSCVNRAFSARKKNFVFLGEKNGVCTVRLKVKASIPELEARAKAEPDRHEIGNGGWTKLTFPGDDPLRQEDLDRWITESYRVLVAASLVKLLDE